MLNELSSALKSEQIRAAFTCGGTIPVNCDVRRDHQGKLSPRTQRKVDNQTITTKPVTIRFGPTGTGQVLNVPTDVEQDSAFKELLDIVQPAQFGLNGRNVYDEEYRKATQLDPTEFCTNFSPYEMGIVDIISQALVPTVSDSRGIRAELYKLNVYSGPSGRFKAHVDTPRSDKQIGSLVVCLPSAFEGESFSCSR